jgi:hypothetical protein
MAQITSLASYKFKWYGLIVALLATGLLITIQCLNYEYEGTWKDRILIMNHLAIIFGLFITVFSKEKKDDDRVKRFRYNLLKFAYTITIMGILAYFAISTLDRIDFSLYVILYIVEGAMVLYLLLFTFCLYNNPTWVFKEKTSHSFFQIYVLCTAIFILVWIVYAIIEFQK